MKTATEIKKTVENEVEEVKPVVKKWAPRVAGGVCIIAGIGVGAYMLVAGKSTALTKVVDNVVEAVPVDTVVETVETVVETVK